MASSLSQKSVPAQMTALAPRAAIFFTISSVGLAWMETISRPVSSAHFLMSSTSLSRSTGSSSTPSYPRDLMVWNFSSRVGPRPR